LFLHLLLNKKNKNLNSFCKFIFFAINKVSAILEELVGDEDFLAVQRLPRGSKL